VGRHGEPHASHFVLFPKSNGRCHDSLPYDLGPFWPLTHYDQRVQRAKMARVALTIERLQLQGR
jgi:hypothetical protein